MATPRGPLDRIVDLAVAVPTCTLVAAKRAVPLAARIGTLGTAKVIGRVSEAVGQIRASDSDRAPADDDGGSVVDVPSAASDSSSSVSVDELAIEGYDDLAARQVVDRLSGLDHGDLGRIEVYEREHRNRSTVLGKISTLTT